MCLKKYMHKVKINKIHKKVNGFVLISDLNTSEVSLRTTVVTLNHFLTQTHLQAECVVHRLLFLPQPMSCSVALKNSSVVNIYFDVYSFAQLGRFRK